MAAQESIDTVRAKLKAMNEIDKDFTKYIAALCEAQMDKNHPRYAGNTTPLLLCLVILDRTLDVLVEALKQELKDEPEDVGHAKRVYVFESIISRIADKFGMKIHTQGMSGKLDGNKLDEMVEMIAGLLGVNDGETKH